jgi:hypothetical protein
MSQSASKREMVRRVYTASQETCPHDGGRLWIVQHRVRVVHCLDQSLEVVSRDRGCPREGCPASSLRFRPPEEAALALSGSSFGLDVVTAVGAMRFREDMSFPRIHERLVERGVPISPMGVQYQLRNYLALVSCQAGVADARLVKKLKKQGVIVPVIDGVQFGEGDAVLYLIIDAISRRALFGKELLCRGADDLVPFVRQLRDLDVPILAVVSDKERGLVPAIEEALPGTPHQFCQLHYVGNAARPMEEDLQKLGAEIRLVEHALRGCERKLMRDKAAAGSGTSRAAEDLDVSLELCRAARAEARRHARAPFDPPALKRHEGIERVARATAEARRKKGGPGRTSRRSAGSWSRRARGGRSRRASRRVSP